MSTIDLYAEHFRITSLLSKVNSFYLFFMHLATYEAQSFGLPYKN